MRCPHCGHDVADAGAAFCPRCGGALGSREAEATIELGGGDTAEIPVHGSGRTAASPSNETPAPPAREASVPPPPETPAPSTHETAAPPGAETPVSPPAGTPAPPGPRGRSPLGPAGGVAAVRDRAADLRRALAATWLDATAAALVAFLGAILVGALGVVALKLDEASVGATATPVDALTSAVLATLASLRVPIGAGSLGDVTIVPLGALALIGAVLVWTARLAVRRREASTPRELAIEGAKLGPPFGLVCCLAALVFAFRGGRQPIAADAAVAFVLGASWGALFGAIGGLTARSSLRVLLRHGAARLRNRSADVYEGATMGSAVVLIAGIGSVIALLLWVIVGLARGGPGPGFGARDAVAAIVYLILFLPNLAVALVALGMGAPIQAGVLFNFRRETVGSVREFSLLDWGGGAAPWYLYLLVLIPAAATVLAGIAAQRRFPKSDMRRVVAIAALAVALAALVLAWLGEASLGAGLVRSRGVARVAPDAITLLVAALAWTSVGGLIGWKLGERQSSPEPRSD